MYDWSTTASVNGNADAAINMAEGMPPSALNDGVRQVMGRVAEYLADNGGALVAGGTANAITVTANSAFTAYADGLPLALRIASANTAATTINANGLGAKSVRKMVGAGEVALSGAELQPNGIFLFRYSTALNSAAGGWLLLNPAVDVPNMVTLTGSQTLTNKSLTSPAMTGTPTTPTATAGTNTTQVASTAFVTAGIAALSTVYQGISTVLTALAGIGTAVSGDIIYASGAGTWARKAKGTDGQFLQLASGLPVWAANNLHIGEGQTWQDVTGSRALSTAYQNSTSRPIMIAVTGDRCRFQVSADNSTYVGDFRTVGDSSYSTASAIIPVGWYYKLISAVALGNWTELR
ncbi:hypothetical protein [Mesorhizobium sp. B2-4-17]|uniref:hypothetical protein n=1 Tax=Mesorhizobium sp. B2-4-17 TaxID=2589932 RepID=UPI001128C2A2|nr:hypothetical protein [Mesorhizobium sp. B2-4-17]TPK85323.1 hypothetical protein FJ548_17430 [Mesorhizobium sp. B2-4-17]